MQYIHTMEYYLAIELNNEHWWTLKILCWMEAARHYNKTHFVWFHLWILFTYDSRIGKSVETDLEVRLLAEWGENGEWLDHGYGTSFWVMVLKLCEYMERWILWDMAYISIHIFSDYH